MEWTSFLSPFMAGLLVATGIGLIIGMEREFNTVTKPAHMAGFRTFPLLCMLGYLTAFLARDTGGVWLLAASVAGLFILVSVAYFIQGQQGSFGMTTEFALLVVFLLGAAVAFGYRLEATAAAVIVTALLSLKEELHGFVKRLTEAELSAFIKFTVLALLLLPMLPNQTFGPDNLLNYRDLGWIIVLVSSISFAGYMLLKFFRHSTGVLLTALVGGLFSSTMIAWVFSSRSRETPSLAAVYTGGILLASTVLPMRVLFLTWIFNKDLSMELLVLCSLILLGSLAMAWYIVRGHIKAPKEQEELPLGNPLDIKNAAFFAVLYIVITLLLFYTQAWMGDVGVYITGAISGIADMDAIAISASKWSAEQGGASLAANVVAVAMLSNTIFKLVIALTRIHPPARVSLLAGFGLTLLLIVGWLGIRIV